MRRQWRGFRLRELEISWAILGGGGAIYVGRIVILLPELLSSLCCCDGAKSAVVVTPSFLALGALRRVSNRNCWGSATLSGARRAQ
jgi:hypothetical protein